MPAPTALDRIYLGLKRLQPPVVLSDEDDSIALREMKAYAYPLARAADYWDSLLPDLFLDTDGLAGRWETLLKLGIHASDALADRAARIEAIMRRRLRYTRDGLASILAPLLGVAASQLSWIEMLRAAIDASLTFSQVFTAPLPLDLTHTFSGWIDVPWPGLVDDTGVALKVTLTAADSTDISISLKHASGAAWFAWPAWAGGSFTGAPGVTLRDRQVFTELPARGPWLLSVSSNGVHGAASFADFSLTVSNDVDARQIYRGYLLRDIGLGVATDISAAQALLERTGIGHTRAVVVERNQVLCDDAHALCDREPIGA